MSGLFGGGATQSMTPQRYNGIQISSSASGGCIPLLYGRQRLPFNLIWYGAFSSTANSSSGGKGGGGSQPSSYTYSASFACAICEGPITNIYQVWNDKDLTSLANLGFTLFTGTSGQAIWSYLTTNFPSQAIPYDHICYVAAQGYKLGDSASMPNITFEVGGFLGLSGTSITFTAGLALGAISATLTSATLANGIWNITFSDFEVRSCQVTGTAVTWSGGLITSCTTAGFAGGVYDADPSAVVVDYLTDPNHGVTFPAGSIATLTGANSYQSYCLALGLTMSPYETTQRAASDFLKEILQITNSDAVWSAGTLKILPYCDAPVTGNGTSFTPNLTPEFIFTDDDFLDIPEVTRIPIADTYNHVRVEFLDRSNSYNTSVAEASDLGNIAQTGERVMDTLSFHELTNSTSARMVAQLVLQTSLYERNTIKFKVRADYSLLEPMDYIGITDISLGYVDQVFRITKITDDDKDEIEIEAMEIPGTVRTSPFYNWSSVQGYNANFAEAPGSVQAPAFLEVAGLLVSASGGRQLWMTVGGPNNDAAWGGAQVYMSFDNVTYEPIGIVTGPGRYGTISSNVAAIVTVPDTTTTMGVALNNALEVLGSGSATAAQDNQMLIAVGSGSTVEIMSYETATLVTAGNYNLTTLYRGLYGTNIQTHSSGAQFMRLDGNVLAIDINPGWMGQTLYFKFCSFNTAGRATELLSAVTDYPYTLGQSTTAYNSVSTSTFLTGGTAVVYSPTTAFKMTTGASAWDSSVYSVQGYTNGSTAECYASQTTAAVMLGLTTNPTASNNETNLEYAWYMVAGGSLAIYESGVNVGSFGTYTTSDLLAIVYDGKHVAYYHNAVLIRSVPIANQTFYMQLCFYTPGGSVYGMSYDSIATAVTPFTLEPLTTAVAAAGTTVIPNNQIATGAWGSRCFQSVESYNAGCQVSFRMGTQCNEQALGLSAAPAAGDTTGYRNFTAGFLLDGAASNVQILFNAANLGSAGSTPLSTDVFTLTYDNFTFRWWRNGTLIEQQYFPNAGSLYLFGDIYDTNAAFPGERFQNISFGPYGQLSPNPFVATNFCITQDSSAYKLSTGTSGWDSAVYSLNAYSTCHVQFKCTTPALRVMVGLCQVPTASNSETNLAYAWYCDLGDWQIYESGTLVGTISTSAVATDLVAITYDGSDIRYYLNSTLERTVAVSGLVLFASSSFYDPGATINLLEFGPSVVLDTQPTATLDAYAATSVSSVFTAGPTTYSENGSGIVTITPAPLPTITLSEPIDNNHVVIVTVYCEIVTSSVPFGGTTSFGIQVLQGTGGSVSSNYNGNGSTRTPFTIQFQCSVNNLYTPIVSIIANLGLSSSIEFYNVQMQAELVKR
jgi:Putative phage tail protein